MNLAFFVEEVKNSESSFDQIYARLVVMEIDERPLDLLTHVLFLLQLKDMLKIDQPQLYTIIP